MTGITRAVRLTILAMLLMLPALMPRAARAGSAGVKGPAAKLTDDNGTCASLKSFTTDIAVDLIEAKPVFDYDYNVDNLRGGAEHIRAQWLDDNGKLKSLWTANDLSLAGLAFAEMDTVYNFEVENVPVDRYGVYYCNFFRTVSIQLLYRPAVKIPNNVKQHSCAFDVIGAHEDLVLDSHKSVLEDFAGRLRRDMPGIAAGMEAGYVGKADLENRAAQMKEDMQEAVGVYLNDALGAKMKQVAAAVDTPEEYTALNAALADCVKKAAPRPPPQGK
jgi:hypothetical protein